MGYIVTRDYSRKIFTVDFANTGVTQTSAAMDYQASDGGGSINS